LTLNDFGCYIKPDKIVVGVFPDLTDFTGLVKLLKIFAILHPIKNIIITENIINIARFPNLFGRVG
jgi:hypothetical protein